MHHEENDSKGVDVDGLATILLSVENLWCHVGESSDTTFEPCSAISTLNWEEESKIGDLDIIIVGSKQDILWLQITMAQTLQMHLAQSHQQLLEEVSGDLFAEATMVHEGLKKLSTSNVLHQDVGNF